MTDHRSHYVKNLFLPCLIFSVVTGVLSALIISVFQTAAEQVIHLSKNIYASVREDPIWLICLVLGVAAIGSASSLIISASKSCRGGGIPTSIAAIRGITGFNWIASVFLLPISALLSFLCGIPLGTEGPCVQLGTGVGNMTDYNVGADKGGAVEMFEDFDIDYNQEKYLIETRCSGALTKPYSAIALELHKAST